MLVALVVLAGVPSSLSAAAAVPAPVPVSSWLSWPGSGDRLCLAEVLAGRGERPDIDSSLRPRYLAGGGSSRPEPPRLDLEKLCSRTAEFRALSMTSLSLDATA